MRHNAQIIVEYTERNADQRDFFHIFLDSYGSPEEVKRFLRRALRGERREVTRDPLRFIVNLITECGKRTQVDIIQPRARDYLYTYSLNIRQLPPRVRLYSETGLSERMPLFAWLGPERRALS